jgi:omega-6 fatty acid desaturase (delta-12 desaturase)
MEAIDLNLRKTVTFLTLNQSKALPIILVPRYVCGEMSKSETPEWYKKTERFAHSSFAKSTWQILNSFVPYLALVIGGGFLFQSQGGWTWWMLPITAFMSLFMVRVFIIMHDCGHGAFWKSRGANTFWGYIFGVLTFTSYNAWRRGHGIHHAHSGNLDYRGIGDIWTLTVEEYKKQHWAMRLWYRIYRHPLMLLLISPWFLFLVLQRFPKSFFRLADHIILHTTNLLIVAMVWSLGHFFGWDYVFLVYLPMLFVTFAMGVWLFYVQHQFDPGYWERDNTWSKYDAALVGSSYYKLPRFFQFFSGNIGFHHIHHARPRIPNYNLEACCKSIPELNLKDPLTFVESLKCLKMQIWDEANRRLLSFREMRQMQKA